MFITPSAATAAATTRVFISSISRRAARHTFSSRTASPFFPLRSFLSRPTPNANFVSSFARSASSSQLRFYVTVQARPSYSPNCMQFTAEKTQFLETGEAMNFPFANYATNSPLVKPMFEVPGVQAVLLADDHVAVTKQPTAKWEEISPAIQTIITKWVDSKAPVLAAAASPTYTYGCGGPPPEVDTAEKSTEPTDEDSEVVLGIKELLNTKVRPMVKNDGGNIRFVGFENGVVYVELQGACQSCSSSTITLKEGVERLLAHYIPEVKTVQQVPKELADEMETVWKAQKSFKGVI